MSLFSVKTEALNIALAMKKSHVSRTVSIFPMLAIFSLAIHTVIVSTLLVSHAKESYNLNSNVHTLR